MNLSDHFTLREFTRSTTADRLGIRNDPTGVEIANMRRLCEKVLEPVRLRFGPVKVNSGFRCLELNRALKSKDTSSHIRGEAADIEVASASNYDLADWISNNSGLWAKQGRIIEFDQVILEFYTHGEPSSGWVHVSFADNNRNETLTITKHGTAAGLFR